MKKIILIVGASLLVGCGPSQQEKERIAEMACAEIMATRNFEEARRIKILNEARLEVGLEPIVSSSLFETNIRLGGRSSCIDYINPPPPPPPPTAKELEQQRIAKEKREKIEEENRIKWEEEERKRAEERKIKEEQERIAAAEADRKAKEKEKYIAKYIAENTKTTHLYCPSLQQDIQRIGPKRFALIELNKIDGDNPELNGYLPSKVYYDIKTSNPLRNRGNFPCAFKESVGAGLEYKLFCAGVLESGIPTEYTNNRTSSYSHSTLKWFTSYGFFLDRVNLIAADHDRYLETETESSKKFAYFTKQYQCEVVSKETYDQKVQEVESKVKAAADAYRAELAEKESGEPQI